MPDPYAAHAQFIRPAWPLRDLWRIAVIVVLVDLIFQITPDILGLVLPSAMLDAYREGIGATGTLMQFAAFAVPGMALVGLTRLMHSRGFWSLIGDWQAAWVDLTLVTIVVVLVQAAPDLLFWREATDGAEMRPIGSWAALVPLALLALLVQVGAEEMFFRGYLQQQLACLSSSRWVWMCVPSVLFGLVHYWNGFGAADGVIWAIWAGLLGLACADLTARTGNLGAAIGLHLSNNIFAVLVYTVQGWPASGLALFVYPYADPDMLAAGLDALLSPWAAVDLLIQATSVLIMWCAARIAIRLRLHFLPPSHI